MNDKHYIKQSPVALDDCGMAELAKVLGDKWMLLIIRQVFYRVAKFEDIRAELGIPRAVLTNRLAKLVELSVVKKVPYQEKGQRARFAYELDEPGLALMPFLVEAMSWGDRFLRKSSSSIEMVESKTGLPVKRQFVNEQGQAVTESEVRIRIVKAEK